MAFDAFLKIEGIEGDSQQKGHAGEIEVSSFSWGETNVSGPAKGTGAGVGKVQMQDFHFAMATSKASPTLMTSCASGKHFPTATLTCRKAGREELDFIVIKMNDVLISGYALGGSTGDVDPEDQVSLAFVKIDYLFRETNERGELVEFTGGA
jgi:type VI secretion system secreted protein Hcp